MTTHLAEQIGDQATNHSTVRTIGQLLPGAVGLVYAGVSLDGGIIAAAYRDISTDSDELLNFPFSGSLATATSLTWGLSQALFVLTVVAFARSGAVGSSRIGRIGAVLTVVGSSVYVAAHAVSLAFRDARMDDPAGQTAITFFVIGTLFTAVGFILAGIAVIRARRWTSWRRYSVLAVGIWVLCMMPLQLTFLLPAGVAIYAVTVAAFSVALLAEPGSQ